MDTLGEYPRDASRQSLGSAIQTSFRGSLQLFASLLEARVLPARIQYFFRLYD